jgi:phosphoribosylformylglycinamidine synthase subunit PurQ / glutaminase
VPSGARSGLYAGASSPGEAGETAGGRARGAAPGRPAGRRIRAGTGSLPAVRLTEKTGPRITTGRRVRVGIVTFPGSLDDGDAARAVTRAGGVPVRLWHAERALHGVDAVILPGGFSYGDYLRCGAIARFAPVMSELVPAAGAGLPVLGICNGFQILCEAHLLPGALTRNAGLHFVNRDQRLRIESTATPWTCGYTGGQEVVIPLKSGAGSYTADAATLAGLTDSGLVVARYLGGDPNGSADGIAGVASAGGNVVGLMPHPEHAIDPLTGPGTDGLGFFASVIFSATAGPVGA